MTKKISISDHEFEELEKLFIDGKNFDNERRKIIECNESCDILAYAGTGKTTTLLAKLKILLDRMPFENNRGICVLTHTNVGIDEIKKRLGSDGEKLFSYPNFFGTIQTFVNQYLAIPFYKIQFNKNVKAIDNDRYFSAMDRVKYRILKKNSIAFIKKNSKLNYPDVITYKDLAKNSSFHKKLKSLDHGEEIYEELKKLKSKLLKDYGILSFDDSFFLAKYYINSYLEIKNLFKNRFKYLFIDEMQDTQAKQWDILKEIFTDSTIVQKFGDINQTIIDEPSDNKSIWKEIIDLKNVKNISKSHRFGKNISNVGNVLRTDTSICGEIIHGNGEDIIEPHIIVFDEKCMDKVLEEFIEIIKISKLPIKIEDGLYKAVGRVGEKKDGDNKIVLRDYYPNFIKKTSMNEKKNNNIKFLLKLRNEERISVKEIYDRISDNLSYVLYENDIMDKNKKNEYFNKNTLLTYMRKNFFDEYREYRKNIVHWVKNSDNSIDTLIIEIQKYLENMLKRIFNLNMDLSKLFFDFEEDKIMNKNKYTKENVDVYIDTIHGVKGETHDATLYLQTRYYKEDLKYFKKFILNDNKPINPYNVREIMYVGMTRPRYILCIAMSMEIFLEENEKFENEVEKWEDNGFKIRNICGV